MSTATSGMFADYRPKPLQWRPFRSDDIGELELPSKMRNKPYLLEENSEIEVPIQLHGKATTMFRLKDFCVLPVDCSADARLSGLDPSTGCRMELNHDQQQSLRKHGEIDVPSRSFDGMHHKWQVAREVYSGTATILSDFSLGWGSALDQVVYAGDAVISNDSTSSFLSGFSLLSAVCRFWKAIALIGDGMTQFLRSYRTRLYSDQTIDILVREAKESYVRKIYRERTGINMPLMLTDKHPLYYSSQTNDLPDCKDEIWEALKLHGEWKESEPPSQMDFDAAKSAAGRFDQLTREFQVKLKHPLTTKERDMINEYDQATAKDGLDNNRNINVAEVSARISPLAAKRLQKNNYDAKETAHQTLWIERVLACDTIPTNFRMHEVDRYKSKLIFNDMKLSDDAEATRVAQECVSGGKNWMAPSRVYRFRRLAKLQEDEKMKLNATFCERLIDRLESNELHGEALKQKIGVEFKCCHEKRLRDKLKSANVPYCPALFDLLHLNPENWKQTGSSFNRYSLVAVDLGKPFWRFRYAFLLFWSSLKWCVGGSSHFLLNGPLSLRAFLSEKPYHAIERPSVDPSTRTSTLRSRLKRVRENLADRKRRFESEEDTGILPKSISRFLLTLQLFAERHVKSASVVFLVTFGTLLSSTLCFLWLLGSPVIAVLWTAVVFAFQLIFVDTALMTSSSKNVGTNFFKNSPRFHAAAPLVKVGLFAPTLVVFGAAELVIACMRLVLLHPVLFMTRLVVGTVRLVYRIMRDGCTWPLLRCFAMVPATSEDTWLAKRVSGPGVSSQYYNRLPIEAAKAAVLRRLQCDRLSAHEVLRAREMDAPYDDFIGMFDASAYGIQTKGMCLSPSAAARTRNPLDDCRDSRKAPLRGLNTKGRWESLALNIRLKETENRSHLQRYRANLQEEHEKRVQQSYETFDLRPGKAIAVNKVSSDSPLGLLVNRTIAPLSNFCTSVTSFRELLNEMTVIPDEARGSFRMTEDEIEFLWKFTIAAVETFQELLRAEILQIAGDSQWLTESALHNLITDFTNKSIAVEAFRILTSIMGEQSLTESMEDLDKSIVFQKGNHIALDDEHSFEV